MYIIQYMASHPKSFTKLNHCVLDQFGPMKSDCPKISAAYSWRFFSLRFFFLRSVCSLYILCLPDPQCMKISSTDL